MSVACVIIASRKRETLLDQLILPSALAQYFDELVVVGDYHSGDGWRHLPFPPLTGSTIDAQFKRDIGTLATKSDWIVYLCDDHRLHPDFSKDLAAILQEVQPGPKDIIVPARFCVRNEEQIGLNMGYPGYMGRAYVGGHAGVYHRDLIREVPWSIAPWNPQWDYFHSRIVIERGANLHFQNDRMYIEDIEPESRPWL